MLDGSPFSMDAGEAGFLLLGAGAVLLLAWQCLQMCRTILSSSEEAEAPAATPAPPLLPRASSSREKATRPSPLKLVREPVGDDLEAGARSGAVTFLPSNKNSKARGHQLAEREKPLQTPLMKAGSKASEGCLSP